MSGKGGMGKTNIIVNLGFMMVKGGWKVLIMDVDFGLVNVDVVLGVIFKSDFWYVIFEGGNIDECIIVGLVGLDILFGSSGVSELMNLDVEQKWVLFEVFELLGECYDMLLVDMVVGIGSNV